MSAYASLPGQILPPVFAFGLVDAGLDAPAQPPASIKASITTTQQKDTSTLPSQHDAWLTKARCPSPRSTLALLSEQYHPKQPVEVSKAIDTVVVHSARLNAAALVKSLMSNPGRRAVKVAELEQARTDDGTLASQSKRAWEDEDTEFDDEYAMYDYSEDFSPSLGSDDEDLVEHEDTQRTAALDLSAMEFKLAVTYQGRQYDATRAFASFAKLRDDMLRELLAGANAGHCTSRRLRMPIDILVPELPRVSSYESSELGGLGSLQATARSYRPKMERWMGEVMAAFPYSRSLARFLWEPLKSSEGCADKLDTIEE